MKSVIKFYLVSIAIVFVACKKEPEQFINQPATNNNLNSDILNYFSVNVAQAIYNDLNAKSQQLYSAVLILDTATNNTNLNACRQFWRDARSAWEQSEGFLFGPVATENIDPRIDTWPTDYVALDSVLASNAVFSDAYINNLDDALRGFHPIEYLLFGLNGNKDAAQLTIREKQYLIALCSNLKSLTFELAMSWNPTTTNNYHYEFAMAGHSSNVYSSKRLAFEELVNAMIGICEEVGEGKIGEPFAAQNPMLEESPFSNNSIADFTDNMRSVQNCYLGKYFNDGLGLEDLVKTKNLSLDGMIKNKINSAIVALNSITIPFGQAIITQQLQVTNAQNAINDLKNTLENNLLPFVQYYTN
jgi:predicted lipoprotein